MGITEQEAEVSEIVCGVTIMTQALEALASSSFVQREVVS